MSDSPRVPTTLYPSAPTFADILPKRQGRSKKVWVPTISFDGVVYVGRNEGRPTKYFAATEKELLNNLRGEA